MELRVSPADGSLRAAADAFHKIVAAHEARRLLDREGHKMPQAMHDDLVGRCLDPGEVTKIAADGFEVCVRALVALGAKDVSVHECGADDLEPYLESDP